MSFTDAFATNSAGASEPIENLGRYYLYMENCAATEYLAKTGDISGDTNFPVNWVNFGPVDKAGC